MSDGMEERSSGPAGPPTGVMVPVRRAGDGFDRMSYEGVVAPAPGVPGGRSLLFSLRRHRWLILSVFLVVCAVSIPPIWLLLRPYYRATAVVRISPVLDPIVFQSEKTGMLPLYDSYVNTQVSIIRSPALLQRVLDRAEVQGTGWYKVKKQSWFESSATTLERLQDDLQIVPRPRTELIDVSMRARTGADAMTIVNVVAAEYEKLNKETHRASDTQLFETLASELQGRRMEIDGLIATKFNIASQLGTTAPEELRSKLSTQLSTLEADRDRLQRDLEMTRWELQWMGVATTRPTSMPAEVAAATSAPGATRPALAATTTSAPGVETVTRTYAEDTEWRSRSQELETARHDAEMVRQQFGEAHPKVKQASSRADFLERTLRAYELRLERKWAESPPDAGGSATAASLVHLAQKQERELALLRAEIERQRAKVAEAGDIAQEIARFEEQIAQKREVLEAVRRRMEVLEMEGKAPARVRIAAYSIEPSKPDRDRRILLTVMAVAGALVCGVGVGYVRIAVDKKIHDASEMEGVCQVPFLGLLPRLSASHIPRELGGAASVASNAAASGRGAVARFALMESMRMIRTALLERLHDEQQRVVLITSALPKTGKTTVSVLLAKSLALIGRNVLLVEADLRKPALSGRLGLGSSDGLAALLAGKAEDAATISRTDIAHLDVLAAGEVPDDFNPELLANGVFADCIERWRRSYDFVVIDTPPLLSVADAQILAGYADGTLMVLRASHESRTDALKAFSQIISAGGNVLGMILIGGCQGGGYGYGYRYHYTYYGSSPNPERGSEPRGGSA